MSSRLFLILEPTGLHVFSGDGVFSKLSREEYVLDVTAEFVRKKIHYDLIFQRTVWIYPLSHMDNEIYVDMMFHQVGDTEKHHKDLHMRQRVQKN